MSNALLQRGVRALEQIVTLLRLVLACVGSGQPLRSKSALRMPRAPAYDP